MWGYAYQFLSKIPSNMRIFHTACLLFLWNFSNSKCWKCSNCFDKFFHPILLFHTLPLSFILYHMLIRYSRQRTLEHLEWNLLGEFSEFKTNGDTKRSYNIICRSIKVMHFCQIIWARLNIGACHAHLKFEM